MSDCKGISGVSLKGGFFEEQSNFQLFENNQHQVAVIYGRNGSGKSSIAKGINEYKNKKEEIFCEKIIFDYEQAPIELSDEERDSIHVFNEEYIENNIRIDESGLSTIVMFGQQVSLEEEIKVKEADLTRIGEEINNKKKSHSFFNDKSNVNSPEYHKDEMMKMLRMPTKWADIDSKIKGISRKSSVNLETIENILKVCSTDTLENLQNQFSNVYGLYNKISGSADKYNNKVPRIVFNSNIEDNIIKLLGIKIDEPIVSERERLILQAIQGGRQKTVEHAESTFTREETTFCPYCYQEVSETYKIQLIREIQSVLNKEANQHKKEIDEIEINRICQDYEEYMELMPDLANEIQAEVGVANKVIEIYKEYIEEKKSNVYSPIEIEKLGLEDRIKRINEKVVQLEEKRQEYNRGIDNKNKIKERLIKLNMQIAWHDISAMYMTYLKQQKRMKESQEELEVLTKDYQKIDLELNKLKQQMKNIKIALDNINYSLEYIFFSKNRLSLQVKGDKYCLKSYGKDVALKNISIGERNIIALCYFFSQILNNCNQGEEFLQKCILIIDDPISSFDFENKIGIHSYLKSQIRKIVTGNSESKIAILTHELEAAFDFIKMLEEVVGKKKYSSKQLVEKKLIDFNTKKHNEYSNLLESIFKFANQEEGYQENELVIGNSIRRVLEAYSTFEYRIGIDQISCKPEILKKIGNKQQEDYFENLMYRLVLNGESHFQERVQSLPGTNFYDFISLSEKVRTSKDILLFLYALNPEHVEAHLKGISNALQVVKSWSIAMVEVS